jgi:hypothetical protein
VTVEAPRLGRLLCVLDGGDKGAERLVTETDWRIVMVAAALVLGVLPYLYCRHLWWRIFERDNPPTDWVDQYYKWGGTAAMLFPSGMLIYMAIWPPPGH